jgi:hypothetical protein
MSWEFLTNELCSHCRENLGSWEREDVITSTEYTIGWTVPPIFRDPRKHRGAKRLRDLVPVNILVHRD